jgi:mannose-6-phosphate isomerase-like protein (cupin superfamily)
MPILVKKIGEAGPLVSAMESRQLRSGYVMLGPGEDVGEHSTGAGEELIVLLEGTAKILADGETRSVNAPSIVMVPAGTRHNVRNGAEVLLRYVYVYVAAMDGA